MPSAPTVLLGPPVVPYRESYVVPRYAAYLQRTWGRYSCRHEFGKPAYPASQAPGIAALCVLIVLGIADR